MRTEMRERLAASAAKRFASLPNAVPACVVQGTCSAADSPRVEQMRCLLCLQAPLHLAGAAGCPARSRNVSLRRIAKGLVLPFGNPVFCVILERRCSEATKSRKYQLTFNNPAQHGFTHTVIKTTLASFPGIQYWCMCDEVGEQGTPHTHLYLYSPNAILFSTLHQRFMGAHIEPARGSHRENRDYIRKEGRWLDDAKRETNLPDTFEESGDLPPERDKRESVSSEILEMVRNGASNAEILTQYPSAMNRLQHIETARQTLLEERFRSQWRELQVTYLWGKTGVGKTRSVMELYGYGNVYHVTNYAHPFDNYRGQSAILFDEFRSSLPIADMLKYLDGYPLMLPCRYSDKVACYTKAFLVSNIPLSDQYPNVQVTEPETYRAFCRRINQGELEMLPEAGNEPL